MLKREFIGLICKTLDDDDKDIKYEYESILILINII